MAQIPRDLIYVVEQIEARIPQLECAELQESLRRLKRDVSYRAPEDMRRGWFELSDLLGLHLGEPNTEWKQDIRRIMENK